MRLSKLIIVFALLQSVCLAQTTWYVPYNFPGGIQEAISDPAVINGDTIIVCPGTYYENIDFLGKAITLKSKKGPEVTIIDGTQSGSVVLFDGAEGPDSVIDGFTLTNGNGTYGGGIYCGSIVSATIKNNIITENSVSTSGGGIFCTSSSPTIVNNTIKSNAAFGGGGIFSRYVDPVIRNNRIHNNSATTGGGIRLYQNSAAIVEGNIMFENSAVESGGAIYCGWNSVDVMILNNIIYENTADVAAGVHIDDHSEATICNNTICKNTALTHGGGITFYHTNPRTLINTILWGNSPDQISGEIPTIEYCDIEGQIWQGTGNISANPLFLDAINGNYRLTRSSPCIDAGDNSAPGIPRFDFEGDPRIASKAGGLYLLKQPKPAKIVDIGADEFYLMKSEHLNHSIY